MEWTTFAPHDWSVLSELCASDLCAKHTGRTVVACSRKRAWQDYNWQQASSTLVGTSDNSDRLVPYIHVRCIRAGVR